MARLLVILLGFLAALPAWAGEPLKVVASFSILGDMVRRIGGDRVAVTTLVGTEGDAHVYQPSPADAKAVAAADVLVVNGLGFEGWMGRLVEASGFKGRLVTAAAGVKPLAAPAAEHGHDHDAVDPHAWQDAANAVFYAKAIADGLAAAAAPADAAGIRARGESYAQEIAALDAWIKAQAAAIPLARRRLVTSHDAFGYFARAYGITFLAAQGVSTDAEPSAKGIAALIRQVRKEQVKVLFVETITDPRLVEQIARETGAVLGGAVYSDALSQPGGGAETYLDMMRHNVRQFAQAMAGS